MPKKAIDFSKTIIYKIVCNDLNITECYVGHTTEFTKRKCNHKSACNNENNKSYNFNVYQFIRRNGNWDNWSMIEIEKYNCMDVNEACKRERFWLKTLKATLNKKIPSRTQNEYHQKYNDLNKENKKQFYQDNKEKLKDKMKLYYQNQKIKKLVV